MNTNLLIAFSLLLAVFVKSIENRDVVCLPRYGDWSVCSIKENAKFEEREELNVISTNLPEKITKVHFDDCKLIETIPSPIFEKFPNVDYVDFRSCSILYIKRGDFSNTKNADEINVSRNQISEIDDYAFDGLDKTITLDLHGNKIKVIRRFTFEGLSNLEELILAKNQIEIIEDGAFNFPKLSFLHLNENRLKSFTISIFPVMPPLKQFLIAKNNLTQIGTLFKHMTQLERIDLNVNPISDLNLTLFSTLPKLNYLCIARTELQLPSDEEIETATSADSHLKDLCLSEDQLSHELLAKLYKIFKYLARLHLKPADPPKDFSSYQILAVFPNISIFRDRYV